MSLATQPVFPEPTSPSLSAHNGKVRGDSAGLGAIAIVLAALALLLALRLGDAPVTNASELRCHDIVQGMLASGDWLVPRRDGQLWLNKPPLLYWSAAGLSKAAGGYSLTTLRAPSAAAALLLVLAVALWARSLAGARAALLAAAGLALVAELHSRGREGSVEMLLCLSANLAFMVFDAVHHRGHARWLPAFAIALALGFLAKATSALLVIGLPITVHLLWRRELRSSLRPKVLGWLLLGLLGGLSWYLALIALQPEAWPIFRNALLLPLGIATEANQTLHAATHYGPWHEQLTNLVKGAMPVTLLLPVVAWRAFTTRLWRSQPRLRFLALIVLSLLVFFCALPQKRNHYLLPSFPALAVLTAESLVAAVAARPRWLTGATRATGLLASLLALAVTAAAALWFGLVWQAPLVVVIGLGLVGLSLAVLGGSAGWRQRLLPLGLCLALGWAGALGLYYGSVDLWRRNFAAGVGEQRLGEHLPHWNQVRDRYPALLKGFRTHEVAEEG